MWLLASTVTINDETYVSNVYKSMVFSEKDKASEILKNIKETYSEYKLFKVSLEVCE